MDSGSGCRLNPPMRGVSPSRCKAARQSKVSKCGASSRENGSQGFADHWEPAEPAWLLQSHLRSPISASFSAFRKARVAGGHAGPDAAASAKLSPGAATRSLGRGKATCALTSRRRTRAPAPPTARPSVFRRERDRVEEVTLRFASRDPLAAGCLTWKTWCFAASPRCPRCRPCSERYCAPAVFSGSRRQTFPWSCDVFSF